MKPEHLEKSKYRGFKIALIGVAIVFIGVNLEVHAKVPAAFISVLIGGPTTLIGMLIHSKGWIKELKTDPKELFKAPKQPWENDD